MRLILPEKVGEKKIVSSFLKKLLSNLEESDYVFFTKEGQIIVANKFARMEFEFGEFIDMQGKEGALKVKSLLQLLKDSPKEIDLDILLVKVFEEKEVNRKEIVFIEEETIEYFLGSCKLILKPYQVIMFGEDSIKDYNTGNIVSYFDTCNGLEFTGFSSFAVPKYLSKITSSNSYLYNYKMQLDKQKRLIEMKFLNIVSSNLSFEFKVQFFNMRNLTALGS